MMIGRDSKIQKIIDDFVFLDKRISSHNDYCVEVLFIRDNTIVEEYLSSNHFAGESLSTCHTFTKDDSIDRFSFRTLHEEYELDSIKNVSEKTLSKLSLVFVLFDF